MLKLIGEIDKGFYKNDKLIENDDDETSFKL